MGSLSRRNLLKGATALAGTLAASPAGATARKGARASLEDPFHQPGNVRTLGQFDYDQVQLLDGPAKSQLEMTMAVIATLPEDNILKVFRRNAGLPAPGLDMGGWYDGGEWGGSTFGQWVSALARYAKTKNSPELRAKVARLLDGFAQTIAGSGGMLAKHSTGYFHDKLTCGCVDAAAHADYPRAWALLKRATEISLPQLPEKALTREEMKARKLPHATDELYTLPENQYLAWRATGDESYRTIARRFLMDEQFFDPLAAGRNVLPGLHAYSHMNALSSGAQAYLSDGDEKYLRAITNAFRMVTEQSWATGGWGPGEFFIEPGSGKLAETLFANFKSSFETACGSYAHFKLTRYLMRITRDSRFGDSMEKVFYNAVLGARPLMPDGSTFYYSDYKLFTGKKIYYGAKWPCCSGTLPQIVNDYGISAYLQGEDGVYVNLYLPSTLKWQQGGARAELTQTTNYPVESTSRMSLKLSRPESFTLYLRVPEWAKPGATIRVNGESAGVPAQPGRFAAIARQWRNGDLVEIEIPMAVRLQPIDEQHPNLVALLRGPLVLFGINQQGPIPRAAFDTLKLVSSGPPQWTLEATAGTLRLRPFMYLQDEDYVTYFGVT
jgi:DUF1680 family protein